MLALLDILDYTHQYTVHNQISPSNIIIVGAFPDASIRLLDYSIGEDVPASHARSKASDTGSVLYMAPEQQDAKRADERSDIYSLGLILFFMFTGRHAKELLLKGEYTLSQMFDKYLPDDIAILTKEACQVDKNKRIPRICMRIANFVL